MIEHLATEAKGKGRTGVLGIYIGLWKKMGKNKSSSIRWQLFRSLETEILHFIAREDRFQLRGNFSKNLFICFTFFFFSGLIWNRQVIDYAQWKSFVTVNSYRWLEIWRIQKLVDLKYMIHFHCPEVARFFFSRVHRAILTFSRQQEQKIVVSNRF